MFYTNQNKTANLTLTVQKTSLEWVMGYVGLVYVKHIYTA